MTNLINQTLPSHFRVDAFVALSAMESVYCVWHIKRNIALAMKMFHVELAGEQRYIQSNDLLTIFEFRDQPAVTDRVYEQRHI